MAWPSSRLFTYTPAAPIRSSDLNALQDAIIGLKHPARPIVCGAQAWQMKAGGTASLGAGQWTFGAVSELVCSLSDKMPEGDRIVSAQFAYNRGGAGNIRLRLKIRDLVGGGAESNVVAETVINAGTGWTTSTITYNYTTLAGYMVWLEVNCDNVAHIIGGAKVIHDRL